MKKYIMKNFICGVMAFALLCGCACANNASKDCKTAEMVSLEKVVLNEVEFENGDAVSINQECKEIEILGTIDKMSEAQKSAFNEEGVNHVVSLKITFDKERTLSYVSIKGVQTKVYSTNSSDENYAGSLSEFLDNESGEDAYAKLVLNAEVKEYVVVAGYSDAKQSELKINIKAALATAEN